MKIKTFNYTVLTFSLLLLLLSCGKKEESKADFEESIKKVIMHYDFALIKVFKQLDKRHLYGIATEKEIMKNDALLIGYINDKTYMESELKDIKFVKIEKISKKEAKAEVWERWRWRHLYIESRKEQKPWAEENQHLMYHLLKDKEKGWIIDSVEFIKQN